MEGVISLKSLLETEYYNIAIWIMAYRGTPEFLIEKYGEGEAFRKLKEISDLTNFFRNEGGILGFPIGMTPGNCILRPHEHVTAAILAGYKDIAYMICNEGPPNYGKDWLTGISKPSDIIDFYQEIPTLYSL